MDQIPPTAPSARSHDYRSPPPTIPKVRVTHLANGSGPQVVRRSDEPLQGAAVSLFTTAKPFEGHASVIQNNALRSWTLLSPSPEIIIVGDEVGYREAASKVAAVHVEQLERNEFGTPLVSDLFDKGHEHGGRDILVFVNADICLLYTSRCV